MKIRKIFKRRKGNKRKEAGPCMVDTVPPEECRMARSLGVGAYDDDYKVTELILASLKASADRDTTTAASISSLDVFDAYEQDPVGHLSTLRSPIKALSEKLNVTETFERVSSAFLRVADLQIHASACNLLKGRAVVHPNYHHPSSDAPPGVEHDPKEEWVALDDGAGASSPIAPYAIAALCEFGLKTALDEGMWKADPATFKFWKKAQESWMPLVWPTRGIMGPIRELPMEPDQVLVWSGNFMHGYYGSDLPAVRAAGLVNMAPEALVEMLMDSTRVKEYNQMSLGRRDLLVLQEDMDPDGPFRGVTKVVQSETQPPMIRKTVQFTTIMHARELPNDGGYLLISRAVHHGAPSILDPNIIRSEILMGLNVIRSIEGDPNQSFMINVNHIRSPLIPLFIAKKLGLTAASNFIHDMRETGAMKLAAK